MLPDGLAKGSPTGVWQAWWLRKGDAQRNQEVLGLEGAALPGGLGKEKPSRVPQDLGRFGAAENGSPTGGRWT